MVARVTLTKKLRDSFLRFSNTSLRRKTAPAVTADCKRIEKILKESEEKYRNLFELAMDAVMITDVETGNIVNANKSCAAMFGYPREKLTGMPHHALQPADKRAGYKIRFDERCKKETSFNNNMVYLRADGAEVQVNVSTSVLELSGKKVIQSVFHDMTERNAMLNQVMESEEKFSKAFCAIPEAVSISRMKDGVFTDVNDNYCRHSGMNRDEVIGRTAIELGIWDCFDKHDLILEGMQNKDHIENMEIAIRTQTGEMHTVLLSAEKLNIHDEPHILAIGNDITERKKAEKALKESEEKFSKTFHAIPESISISRVKDGVFIDVNDNFCRARNFPRNDIIGRTAEELKLFANLEGRNNTIKEIQETGIILNREFSLQSPSGEKYYSQLSADIIDIAGEPCLIVISSDITERKRMEKALKDSEERFSKTFNAIPESIAISRVKDGVFLEVNANFCRVAGRSYDEVIGHTAVELGASDSYERRDEIIKTIQERGGIVNQELVFYANTDKMRTTLFTADIIDIGGEPCLISLSTDITTRKHMEQALKESEEKFSRIFRLSPQQIIITRLTKDNKLEVMDVNDSFLHLFSLTREEVLGDASGKQKFLESLKNYNKVQKTTVGKSRLFNQEMEFPLKSGDIRTGLVSSEPMEINGETCFITIMTDITDRKQAEEKLKRALAELQVSSAQLKATNKELESFSYSVSHDLHAPLRSIDGFSQALLEDYAPKLDGTAKDYLNRMRNASQKMGDLIDGLLKLSRVTRGEMHVETVDLSALAHEISSRLQETSLERKAEFIIRWGLKAKGDPQMLRVMMENLVGNAWKFTQKVPVARIEFGSTGDDDNQTYYIKDNGAGFDMAYQDKLFGAFQRLHDTVDFPGAGIGLATVQRIINRHGGNIRAEGAVGRGAAFYFTL